MNNTACPTCGHEVLTHHQGLPSEHTHCGSLGYELTCDCPDPFHGRTTPAAEPEHKHLFTIPVEYAVHQNSLNTAGQYRNTTGLSVTKLRCECGEETDR